MVVQDGDETKGGKPFGEFITRGTMHQNMACAGPKTGITHSQNNVRGRPKTSALDQIEAKWKIPDGATEVVVRATALYEYSRAGHARKTVKL